jgi:hypothetical protein
MPFRFSYPTESWSQRKLRTRADVEQAANIRRRAQSGVRGWSEEHDIQPGDNHVQQSRRSEPTRAT